MEGLSRTTLARARAAIAKQFFPSDPASDDFREMVNIVMERFYEQGGWRGAISTYALTVSSGGRVTLPYFLDSILMFRLDTDTTDSNPGEPGVLTGGMSYEFLYHGPGKLDETKTSEKILVDEGEVATAAEFPSTASTLTVEISDSDDAGKAIRILGVDSSSNEVHDSDGAPGERVVLVDSSTTTSASFSDIYAIHKPTTQGRVTIKHGSDTLSTLQPSDTHPLYRRYKVAHRSAQQITALCRRRYVPVVDEEDAIIPGSLIALENGLRALNYDRNGDPEKGMAYWQSAMKSLTGDNSQYRGGEVVMPQMNPYGIGVGKIQSIL